MLADEHEELEIRVGATTSYSRLLAAHEAFADGQGFFVSDEERTGAATRFMLSNAVANSWIDHSENGLVIAVDPRWVPRQVAAVVLTGNPDGYSSMDIVPHEELLVTIQGIVEQRLGVPVRVMRARISP